MSFQNVEQKRLFIVRAYSGENAPEIKTTRESNPAAPKVTAFLLRYNQLKVSQSGLTNLATSEIKRPLALAA